MDTGGRLIEYMHTVPGDTAQFYGIRTWKRTDDWWREEWDAFPAGFVEDAVEGKVTGRWTPPQVSRRLKELAEETIRSMETAAAKTDARDAEFRATRVDMQVHAYLAQYHAAKISAAMHLGFFQLTGDAGRLRAAREPMRGALSAWNRIVAATEGVYHDNLVFGHAKDSQRSRGGHHHSGHWKGRLPEIEADVEYLEQLLAKHQPINRRYKQFPAETPPENLPHVEHEPVESIVAGQPHVVHAKITSPRKFESVRLHFRPLDQTVDWRHVEMASQGGGQFEAVVPAEKIKASVDMMYYVEVLDPRGGTIWPSWQERQPYIVVKIEPDDAIEEAARVQRRFFDVFFEVFFFADLAVLEGFLSAAFLAVFFFAFLPPKAASHPSANFWLEPTRTIDTADLSWS